MALENVKKEFEKKEFDEKSQSKVTDIGERKEGREHFAEPGKPAGKTDESKGGYPKDKTLDDEVSDEEKEDSGAGV